MDTLTLHFDLMGGEHPGTPLVILHGLFGSSTNWRSIAQQCAMLRPVFTLDLRNHGRSGWHDNMNYPAMAADVVAFMQQQGIGSAHILGHSMGGKVAMVVSLTVPEQVASLTVADIAPVDYAPTLIAYIKAMRSLDMCAMQSRADIDLALARTISHEKSRAFLLQNLTRADGQYRWRLNLDVLAEHISEISGFPDYAGRQYSGPGLFVHGAQSDYVQPDHEAVIRRYFPAAELSCIKQAGHWLHVQQPQIFLERLHRFLGHVRVFG